MLELEHQSFPAFGLKLKLWLFLSLKSVGVLTGAIPSALLSLHNLHTLSLSMNISVDYMFIYLCIYLCIDIYVFILVSMYLTMYACMYVCKNLKSSVSCWFCFFREPKYKTSLYTSTELIQLYLYQYVVISVNYHDYLLW